MSEIFAVMHRYNREVDFIGFGINKEDAYQLLTRHLARYAHLNMGCIDGYLPLPEGIYFVARYDSDQDYHASPRNEPVLLAIPHYEVEEAFSRMFGIEINPFSNTDNEIAYHLRTALDFDDDEIGPEEPEDCAENDSNLALGF